MLTFLNTFFAWILLAAALPLLIHLFTRKKLKVIPFSSLQFLQVMQKEKIRQVKLRQWLLLLLRTLAILFLVLAFMRPTLKTSALFVGQKAKTSFVLIVDNSLSMAEMVSGQSYLALARQRGKEIAGMMQPGDEVSIITAGFPAQALAGGPFLDTGKAMAALEQIEQTAGATDLQRALDLAMQHLATSPNLNKEIYLLSDNRAALQADALPAQNGVDLRLYTLDWPRESRRNVALTDIRIENQIFEVRKPVELRVTVANTGDVDESAKRVSVLLNGSRAAQTQVDIPAGQTREVVFRVVPELAGYQRVTAEIENDRLMLDNRRHALFHIPAQTRVLLTGAAPEDALFVRLALAQSGSDTTLQLRQERPEQLASLDIGDYDAIVLCNVPAINAALALRLQQYLQDGGGVILFLGNDVDLRSYNQEMFERLRLGRLGESLGSLTNEQSILRLGTINFGHPLFQGVFSDESSGHARKVDSPAFRFAVQAHPHQDAETIMSYSNGSPFLLERRVGEGAVLAFLSAADASWSDLAFKGLFAPLVNRAVRYVAGKGGLPGKEIYAGEPAEVRLTGSNATSFSIKTPAAGMLQVRPEIRDAGYFVSTRQTAETGFYDLLVNEREAYVWAVNFDPGELQQEPMAAGVLQNLVGRENLLRLDATVPVAEALTALRYGTELWQLCLALALLCLLAEMLLFRSRPEPIKELSFDRT